MNKPGAKDAAIAGLRAYRDELRLAIGKLQGDMEHVERSLELLQARGLELVIGPTEPAGEAGPYATLKPQAAVERFLGENPGEWFRASEVCTEVGRLGLPRTAKAFGSTITGALNRATVKRLAEKQKRGGVFQYRLRPSEKEREEQQ